MTAFFRRIWTFVRPYRARLLLEVKENDLRGIAEVGPADGGTILNVGFGPPEDIKPPEPKK